MDLTSIDYYLKPSPRPPKPFKAVSNVSDGNVDDADVNDEGDGKGDDPLGDDDVDTRLAHRPPTTEQVEPVEPNGPIGKYAQYFEEIGAKQLNTRKQPSTFGKENDLNGDNIAPKKSE